MTKFMARQGDVLIVSIVKRPDGLTEVPRDKGRVVLAYGEVTGHAHAIRAPRVAMYRANEGEGGAIYLSVPAGVTAELQHEEHATVAIPPGDYEIVHQREYSPAEIRRVAD